LNTNGHEEISNKGLAIVRRYELDSNADSLSLPESHALLRTMTAALQQNVDEDNNIITNAHGTIQSKNLIIMVVAALNGYDWNSCSRCLLFTTWFLIFCRTVNDQIDQQRFINSRDIGSVKLTREMTGYPEEEKVVTSGGKRAREETAPTQNLSALQQQHRKSKKQAVGAGYNQRAVTKALRCPGCGSAHCPANNCHNVNHPQHSTETCPFIESLKYKEVVKMATALDITCPDRIYDDVAWDRKTNAPVSFPIAGKPTDTATRAAASKSDH